MTWIKHRLIAYLTRNLLVALTSDDLLTITNKGVSLGKKRLSPEEVAQIKEEARQFSNSYVWKLMSNEIRYEANLRMFEKGIIPENTTFGRAMLYDLGILETFLRQSKKL